MVSKDLYNRSALWRFLCQPFPPLSRMNFFHAGELIRIGLSTLPGCQIKESRRSVPVDLETLKASGVTDLFVFSTEAELAT